ncbi:hypothetical protein FIBSPDRAFT_926378 [Athelia psychrophila]|uniref:Uncharacterized protein n=1 Tax=Athelia psychrophila TaxID=1759441 RepID=A0A166TEA4_9AGAM|nr:hypothetical protein FIBSPDRAFT_926378 [Fibularhizoctonia sp. CBS 109695]
MTLKTPRFGDPRTPLCSILLYCGDLLTLGKEQYGHQSQLPPERCQAPIDQLGWTSTHGQTMWPNYALGSGRWLQVSIAVKILVVDESRISLLWNAAQSYSIDVIGRISTLVSTSECPNLSIDDVHFASMRRLGPYWDLYFSTYRQLGALMIPKAPDI